MLSLINMKHLSDSRSKPTKQESRINKCCNQVQDLNQSFMTSENQSYDKEKFIEYYLSCLSESRSVSQEASSRSNVHV